MGSGMGRTHGQTLSRKSTPAATSIADRQCTCKWLLTASLPPILSRLTPRRVAWRLLAASRPVATDLVGIPCLFWARTISHSGEALRHRYLHGSRWPEGPAAPHEATRAEGREAAGLPLFVTAPTGDTRTLGDHISAPFDFQQVKSPLQTNTFRCSRRW